jgi:putative ATP-binding cassette transporter
MRDPRKPAVSGYRFARALWRLLRIYWTSPDAKNGGLLLALAIGLELATVYGNVLVADASRRAGDALADRSLEAFATAMLLVVAFTVSVLLASTYRIYFRQLLEIRWRRSVTAHYLERWIGPESYLQAEMHRGQMDNPDQRIAEDIRDFVASALGLSLSLLAAIMTLISFGGILWRLSGDWPLTLGSVHVRIPGFMLWVAILYALVAMWITHIVGRCLVPINFDKLRFEADFRYGLVRFRDNVEAVALSNGQTEERRSALDRFGSVIENWRQLIRAQRNLMLFTTGFGQVNGLVPLLLAAPSYFAGLLTLGAVAQARIAYGQVSGSLTWFVNAYQEIARWRASIERLSTFAEMMDTTHAEFERGEKIRIAVGDERLRLVDLKLRLPDGRVVLDRVNAAIEPGERVAVLGPSGVGKTTLIRAVAGIWPFGSGRIERPADMLVLPQRPYLPIGSLRAVLSYPAPAGTFADDRIVKALRLLDLGHLGARLDSTEPWEQELSAPEQQRLALARVLLHEPGWILLDEATSGLDEALEQEIYELLAKQLPHAAVMTVSHRPALARYHQRSWTLARKDGRVTFAAA